LFLAVALLLLPAALVAAETEAAPITSAAAGENGKIEPWKSRQGRSRPLVAVVGENAGTELIDFVVPYGVLKESGAADVVALATGPGPLAMRPALRLQPHQTIAEFDTSAPLGADYVIVPAVSADKVADPVLLGWLREQSAKGATVVSICDGALVVANAGLFEGRRATGHWATREQRVREHPGTRWLGNVRYVADGNVVSSAGVSAAIPVTLALVEAIGGTDLAARTAARLGATDWSTRHDSEQFRIGAETVFTYIGNKYLARSDRVVLPVSDGVDDVALALVVDAYGRTLRTRIQTQSALDVPVRTSHGLLLLPSEARTAAQGTAMPGRTLATQGEPSVKALDRALADIGTAYGGATARYVGLELEYAPAYLSR
jgi:transcriptional regulator GlxA family with amidase domain